MTSKVPPTIGFIGTGAIGRPMAECMLAKYPIVVCDVNEAARNAFIDRTSVVASAQELGASTDIVFACLPTLESYRQAILAPNGLATGGRVRHFVLVGTTGPDLVHEINAALTAKGITMLDAPVSGGPTRAKAGELAVMASGPRDLFTFAEPMIRSYATSVEYFGETPGLAQTMKLVNNVLSAANLAVACEVLVLGVKAGLEPRQMLEVINHGTGANSATVTKIPDHLMNRKFNYGGRLELVQKDLALFVDQSKTMGLSSPLSELVNSIYKLAISHEGMDGDMTEVVKHMERAAGIEVGYS